MQRCVNLIRSCKYIWFSFFFLSRGSQKAPDHPRTRKCRFLIGKSAISWKKCLLSLPFICESSKISENRAEMARDITEGWPNVDPTLTQRWPKVDRRSGVGSPQGALEALRWRLGRPSRSSPPNVFFSGEEKCVHFFFRPIGATVDLEKCWKCAFGCKNRRRYSRQRALWLNLD